MSPAAGIVHETPRLRHVKNQFTLPPTGVAGALRLPNGCASFPTAAWNTAQARSDAAPRHGPAVRLRAMDGSGYTDRYLTADETREIVRAGLASLSLAGKRVLFIIPDGTRTMPMPELFRDVPRNARRQGGGARLPRRAGHASADGRRTAHAARRARRWSTVASAIRASTTTNGHDPATFATDRRDPGRGDRARSPAVDSRKPFTVSLNRRIFDYDQLIICGPVFPHEVVGFSGGNKYFFPGIAGPDVINFTHWLGALITNYEIIGAGYTPVRAVIDRAASMVTVPDRMLRAGGHARRDSRASTSARRARRGSTRRRCRRRGTSSGSTRRCARCYR